MINSWFLLRHYLRTFNLCFSLPVRFAADCQKEVVEENEEEEKRKDSRGEEEEEESPLENRNNSESSKRGPAAEDSPTSGNKIEKEETSLLHRGKLSAAGTYCTRT